MLFNSNSNKLLFAALFLALCTAAVPKSFAASASQTYTVTIPGQTNVVLAGSATNFGTIDPAKFGTNDHTTYQILLGDGTDSATSYVQSNDPTAGAKQYTITAAPGTGATAATFIGNGTLALSNGSAASVQMWLGNGSGYSNSPSLGSATPVTFAGTGGTLNIPVSSSVPFLASDAKAPLGMRMGLDMSTVTIADAAGPMSFSLTLTAVSL